MKVPNSKSRWCILLNMSCISAVVGLAILSKVHTRPHVDRVSRGRIVLNLS